MKVNVFNETDYDINIKYYKYFLYYSAKTADIDGEVNLLFCDDEYIKNLNKEFRNKDKATDVLTFRLKDDESFPDFGFSEELGDIFISLDAVGRNASSFGVPFSEELTRIMLHGVMHLMGFDHESNDFTKEEMLLKQEDIMTKLGYKC